MLEDYKLLIELVFLLVVVYGVSSYIGDKIEHYKRMQELEAKERLKEFRQWSESKD